MLPLLLLAVSFDASHCRSKCESLFGDALSKKQSCLAMCAGGFVQREKIHFGRRHMKKEVGQCLEKCNQNVSSATEFQDWTRCRRLCVINPATAKHELFPEEDCNSACDRYWKGTVHYKPCQDQCRQWAPKQSPGPTPPPDKPNIFHVW